MLFVFFRAEAKLLEETARPLIDTLGKMFLPNIVCSVLWVCVSDTVFNNYLSNDTLLLNSKYRKS